VRHTLHSLFTPQTATTTTVFQVKKYLPEGNERTVLPATQLVYKLIIWEAAFHCLGSPFCSSHRPTRRQAAHGSKAGG